MPYHKHECGRTYPDCTTEEEESDTKPPEGASEGREYAEEGCQEECRIERRGATHEIGTWQRGRELALDD